MAPKTFLKRRGTYEMFRGLKLGFQLLEHLIYFATFQNRLRHLNSKPFNITELSCSHQNVYVRCSKHPQTTFGVQHTEQCIKDISFLLFA